MDWALIAGQYPILGMALYMLWKNDKRRLQEIEEEREIHRESIESLRARLRRVEQRLADCETARAEFSEKLAEFSLDFARFVSNGKDE